MKRFVLFLLFVFSVGAAIKAQDIHYSQFYNSPLNINPAKTGIFNGDKRVNLSYRNQWTSIVPWTTFSGSYDMKFYPKKNKDYFFSGGVLLNYDSQSHLADLNLLNLNLTGSFTKQLNEHNLLTFGALLGFANRAIETTSLTWDSQWDGRTFDSNLPSLENFDTESVSFLESGLGLNYRWQQSKRTKLDLGVGLYHLIEPNVGFFNNNDVTMPRRVSLTGIGSFMLTQGFDIQLQALGQFQGDYKEFQFGGVGKIHVSRKRGKELEVHLGVGYRTSEVAPSIFPILAIQYKNFYGSINYDLDMSNFNDTYGVTPKTIEMHFSYIITDVKPFKKVKVCPIF